MIFSSIFFFELFRENYCNFGKRKAKSCVRALWPTTDCWLTARCDRVSLSCVRWERTSTTKRVAQQSRQRERERAHVREPGWATVCVSLWEQEPVCEPVRALATRWFLAAWAERALLYESVSMPIECVRQTTCCACVSVFNRLLIESACRVGVVQKGLLLLQ